MIPARGAASNCNPAPAPAACMLLGRSPLLSECRGGWLLKPRRTTDRSASEAATRRLTGVTNDRRSARLRPRGTMPCPPSAEEGVPLVDGAELAVVDPAAPGPPTVTERVPGLQAGRQPVPEQAPEPQQTEPEPEPATGFGVDEELASSMVV